MKSGAPAKATAAIARPEAAARSAHKSKQKRFRFHIRSVGIARRAGQGAACAFALTLAACAADGDGAQSGGFVFQVGSGFAIAPGVIATAAHVVEDCSSITVLGARFRVSGVVAARDDRADLALLSAPGAGLAPLRLSASAPNLYATLQMAGYPGGWPGWTPHRVEGFLQDQPARGFYPVFTHSGPLHPGMSGGPALDARGAVVGVISARGARSIANNAAIAPVTGFASMRDPEAEQANADNRFPADAPRVGRVICRR